MLRGLRTSGRLTPEDEQAAARLVERSYALHIEPPPEVFDTQPAAVSWFIERETPAAAALVDLAADVVALLDRYGIACREVRCTRLDEVTYSDDVQVVAIPATADRWPF